MGPRPECGTEVLVPNVAIKNLIREDKVYQIYSMMQMGQNNTGMQTMNQSLAALYRKRLISRNGSGASSSREELEAMVARGTQMPAARSGQREMGVR